MTCDGVAATSRGCSSRPFTGVRGLPEECVELFRRRIGDLPATLALVFLGTAACEVTSGADVTTRASRDLQVMSPEAVGMSSDRLALLSDAMQGIVNDGKLAGIVTMVARRGKVCRLKRLSERFRTQHVAMARLGDRRFRQEYAVRSVCDRTVGR